jgi:hypothetical protein
MKNQLLIMKRNQLNLGNLIKSNLLDQLCKLLSRIKKKKKTCRFGFFEELLSTITFPVLPP